MPPLIAPPPMANSSDPWDEIKPPNYTKPSGNMAGYNETVIFEEWNGTDWVKKNMTIWVPSEVYANVTDPVYPMPPVPTEMNTSNATSNSTSNSTAAHKGSKKSIVYTSIKAFLTYFDYLDGMKDDLEDL